MRRFFFIINVLLFFTLQVFASSFPSYVDKDFHYGIGVIGVRNNSVVKIFEKDDEKSRLSAYLKIAPNRVVIKERGVSSPSIQDVFAVYKEGMDFAFLTVEHDSDDWYYVCYDRKRNLFGWVKKADDIDFISWRDFYNFYGRKNGILVFRNADAEHKKLFSNPSPDSTHVDDFYFAKHIALWLLQGDWMLVKVTTYDGQTKTGWLRWRLPDGTIIAFPDFE